MVCLSSFQLQGYYGTPLCEASENGHTEIVALLLQAEGIDVNKSVSSMTPTLTMSPYHPTTGITYPYHHYWCGMFVLYLPIVTSCGSLGEWSHRGSSFVVTGRGD